MAEIFDTIRESWTLLHGFELPTLGIWSYIFIAMLVATEGPLTTLIGAAAAAAGYLDIRLVFTAAFVGNITGDFLWYGIGATSRRGTTWLLTRCPGMTCSRLAHLDDKMRDHATSAVLLSKVTFGLIIPTLIAAGRAHVSVRKLFPAVLVAETLWTLLIVTLGFYGAGAIGNIGAGLRLFGIATAIALLAVSTWFVLRKRTADDSLITDSLAADHSSALAGD